MNRRGGVGVVLTSNSDMRSGQEFHRMLLDIQTIRGSSPVMERRLYYRIFQNSDTQTFACMTECVDSCAAKFLTIDRDPQRSFFIRNNHADRTDGLENRWCLPRHVADATSSRADVHQPLLAPIQQRKTVDTCYNLWRTATPYMQAATVSRWGNEYRAR